jgi:hypothetical protein
VIIYSLFVREVKGKRYCEGDNSNWWRRYLDCDDGFREIDDGGYRG